MMQQRTTFVFSGEDALVWELYCLYGLSSLRSDAGEITTRKMFGDYGIYCDGKIFGLICDDRFYLKPTEAVRPLLRTVEMRPPYPGAKDYFYIADVDDRDYLSMLVRETINIKGKKVKR